MWLLLETQSPYLFPEPGACFKTQAAWNQPNSINFISTQIGKLSTELSLEENPILNDCVRSQLAMVTTKTLCNPNFLVSF